MDLSPRVEARIARDYAAPEATRARAPLASLCESGDGPDGYELVGGAVLVLANGHFGKLTEAIADAKADWRDVLMYSGLENDDWRERLDNAFGPKP